MGYLARPHNPITQRELAHQHSSHLFGSPRLQAAYRVFYYPALTMTLVVFLSELGAALQPGGEQSAALVLRVAVIFALVVAVLMHLYLLLQTLIRSATSIARERQAGTWENLIMTGADARRLIRGKWWATLRGTLGGYALLVPLRAGVVVWLGAIFDRTQMLDLEAVSSFAAPSAIGFFATIPVIAIFTIGGAMLVAAASVLASVLSRSLVQALALAFGLTALVFGGAFAALGIIHYAVTTQEAVTTPEIDALASIVTENVLITWFDNGVTLTSELVNYQTEFENVSRQYAASTFASRKATAWVLTFAVCIGLYLLLTWLMLRLAERWAVRQGALPPSPRLRFTRQT